MFKNRKLNSPVTELVSTLLFSPCVWIFEKNSKRERGEESLLS